MMAKNLWKSAVDGNWMLSVLRGVFDLTISRGINTDNKDDSTKTNQHFSL